MERNVLIYCFGEVRDSFDMFAWMENNGIESRDDYELWTLNNWYNRIPDAASLDPDRVYEVHKGTLDMYPDLLEHAAMVDGEVVVVEDLGLSNQRLWEDPWEFENTWYSCSLSYMLTECIMEGVDRVMMYGTSLVSGGRGCELHGLVGNIAVARENEIEVLCPWEDVWKLYLDKMKPEWVNVNYGKTTDRKQYNLTTGKYRTLTQAEYAELVSTP